MSQSVNSTFELTEYGETRMLLDSLQYQLDGVCTTTSTPSRRRLCLWKLFELCSKNADKLRTLSQSRDLLRLPALLNGEKDLTSSSILCLLTLSLLRSQNGAICLIQELPEFSFQALCTHAVSSLSTYFNQGGQLDKDEAHFDDHHVETGLPPKMHLKRKFRSEKKVQLKSEVIAETRDFWQTVPIDIEQLTTTFSRLCPEMTQLLCCNNAINSSRTKRGRVFSGLLALMLICRLLFASVECAVEFSPTERTESGFSHSSSVEHFQRIICTTFASAESSAPFLLKFRQLFSSIAKTCGVKGEAFYAGSDLDTFVLWNLVSIFESVCFRAPQYRNLGGDLHEGVSVPCEVFDLLQSLTKDAFASISDDFISTVADLDSTKTAQPALNAELQSLQALFPELTSHPDNLHEEKQHLKVQKRDLWLACLKLLVNLSNNASNLMWAFQRSNEGIALIITCLLLVTRYRCAIRVAKAQSSNAQQIETLSPGELPFERFVYDVCLYLLSLLTNIVESSDNIEQLLLPDERTCMSTCESFLPEGPFLQHKHHFPCVVRGKSALLNALLHTLEIETSSFIEDLKSNTKAFEHCTPQPTPCPKKAVSLPKAADHFMKENSLPVAELVLSGHTSLLLFSLAQKKRGDIAIERIITDSLPYSNWWLPMRTLKAFLSLQMHSGVIVVENITPVVYAIRCMEQGVMGVPGNGSTPNQSDQTNYICYAQHRIEETYAIPANSVYADISEVHPNISGVIESVPTFVKACSGQALSYENQADGVFVHSTQQEVFTPQKVSEQMSSHCPPLQQNLENVSNSKMRRTDEEWFGLEPPKTKRKFGQRG